jgi:outer membrane protein assembly factor BamB
LSHTTIVGDDGSPILYASTTSEGILFLQFEYFARDENEGDYEFNHTVESEEFPKIAQKFGLNPALPVLENLMQISASGRGQEFQDLLTNKEIPNEFWSWLN